MTGEDHWRRRSIRLRDYDYSQAGAYFVTICAQNRFCCFGDINESNVVLSEPGTMVMDVWNELAKRYAGVVTDAIVVMPNHVHGILMIIETDQEEGQPQGAPVPTNSIGWSIGTAFNRE